MADRNCPQPLGDDTMTISLRKTAYPTHSIFDNLFDPFFESVTIPTRKTSTTNTHVSNEDDRYIISIAAPGLDKEDFNITITEGMLTVVIDKAVTGFGTTTFAKTWTLPEGTAPTSVTAEYNQGILRLNVMKPEKVTPETTTIKVS
jgi:HSP20 family protein